MSVSLTDQDNSGLLQTYCYDNCSIDDTEDTKISRGLIYKDNKPFIKSFGFTPEFTTQNIDEECKQYIINNFKNFRFFHSVEGTLLRLYWNDVNEKWYISSHKKLDARNSRWGSKQTFGEIIDTILPQTFYDTLDKEYCYLFILTPNQDNRIVCNILMNSLFHVGTYAKDFSLSFDFNINIPRPIELHFQSYEELCDYVETHDFKYMCYQGILICDVPKQSNIKILNSNYNNLKNIRGNTPSIMFRYLEVRNDESMRQALISMFPNHIQKFQQYEIYHHIIYLIFIRGSIMHAIYSHIAPFLAVDDAAAMLRIAESMDSFGTYADEASNDGLGEKLPQRFDAAFNYIAHGIEGAGNSDDRRTASHRTNYFRET